jgi:hypothetical protein
MPSSRIAEIASLLRFPADGRWLPLPTWARFFIHLGSALARVPLKEGPLLVSVVAPAAEYAAALCALGAVTSGGATPLSNGSEDHFEHLAACPAGTTVVYRPNPATQVRGVLAGVTELQGRRFLVIQVQSRKVDGLSYNAVVKVSSGEAHKIDVAAKALDRVPARVASRQFRARAPLLEKILESESRYRFLTTSELRCVIMGRASALKPQILEIPFGIDESGITTGFLQEILRVRSYLERDGGGFLSDVVPYSSLEGIDIRDQCPMVAVFDGSDAFLKTNSLWPRSHRVAILGRTDPRLDEAAAELNRICVETVRHKIPEFGQVPNSVEVLVV